MSIYVYDTGKEDGIREAVHRMSLIVANKICFDHFTKGTCEHQACWELVDVMSKVHKEFPDKKEETNE